MSDQKVRFGVIGTGGMGSGHCNHMNQVPGAELTAVCDIDPDTLAAVSAKHEVPAFAQPELLLDSGLVDAVVIATPHYFHPPIAIEAFSRGIHVLSEKPIGVTVSAADQMIAAAEASGCKFGVMYQMRSLGSTKLAKQLIDDGRLGELYRTSMVLGWYRSQAYYNSGGWRATWAGEGGGVLINQAPHFLDLFAYLGGMPVKMTGSTRTRIHDIEVEDEAFAMLEYASGAHGYLYATTTESPSYEQFEFCGNKGKIQIQNGAIRFWETKGGIREHSLAATQMWEVPESPEVTLDIPAGQGRHIEITEDFVRAILYGEELLSPGRDGLMAVELIDGLIMAGHTGEPVTLPVDRAKYDAVISELQANSQAKAEVNAQRVTDPHYTT